MGYKNLLRHWILDDEYLMKNDECGVQQFSFKKDSSSLTDCANLQLLSFCLAFVSMLLFTVPLSAQQIMILTDKGEDYYGSERLPIISGQVTAPAATELTLRTYRDYITFQEDTYTAKMHRDGSFAFLNVNIERPTVGLLTYNDERVEVYLEPDDQLFVTFDGRQFLPTLAFSGAGSSHNNYLVKSLQQFYKSNTESLNYEMTQRGATDFREYLDGLRAEKLAYFKKEIVQYADDYSKEFLAFAEADIDYW